MSRRLSRRLGLSSGRHVYSGTMAAAPSAALLPVGTMAFFSDVGINGSEMVVSASGTWVPHNGRTLLTRLTLPLVKAPTIPADASPTANGAITFGTAVGAAYAKCYCYFAANVVNASQPAGFYYMEMSSTTAAIVYNNVYTPAAGTFPTEPTSKTAFSGAVPGGAGSTAEITFFVFKINGGLLGDNGCVIYDSFLEANNTAGAKQGRIKWGATQTHTQGVTSSTGMYASGVSRALSSSRQRHNPVIFNSTTTSAAVVTTANTAADFDVTFTGITSGAATDWIALSSFNVSVEVA